MLVGAQAAIIRAVSSSQPRCLLITIPISHYCEKARWALDRAGIAYRERPHLQLIHRLAVRRAGGGRTVPVLVWGDRVLADSADILDAADTQAPPDRRLYPEDPRAAAEVRELERRVRLAPGTARAAVDVQRAAWPARPGCHLRLHRGSGLGAAGARGRLSPPGSGDRSVSRCHAGRRGSVRGRGRDAFDAVRKRLEDGRPYLCGERFSAADLTFAALAAAVLMPPEYGVPLPQPDELPAADGGGGARASGPSRRRPRAGDVPRRAALTAEPPDTPPSAGVPRVSG